MRILFSLIASFSMLTAPAIAADATAVVFYADWCSSCKMLEPVLEEAVETYEDADIEIVRLDFTKMDWDSVMKQAEIAQDYGISDVVTLNGVKTGYALLVVDGDVRGRVGAGMDVSMMHDAFTAALIE